MFIGRWARSRRQRPGSPHRCAGWTAAGSPGGAVALFSLSSNLKLLVETLGLAASLHPVEDLQAALNLVHER